MLVLRRDVGESVMVGDAEVRLLEVHGRGAKLGIEADQRVLVDRKEIRTSKAHCVPSAAVCPAVAAMLEKVAEVRGILNGSFDHMLWREDEVVGHGLYVLRAGAAKAALDELAKLAIRTEFPS